MVNTTEEIHRGSAEGQKHGLVGLLGLEPRTKAL
jgi:hypothetical protein